MNLEELFFELGYTKEEFIKIRNNYSLKTIKDETLYIRVQEIYNYLLENSYSKKEIIKITKVLPAIYGYSIENLNQKIEDMMSLGYTKEEVIKMTKNLPAIYSLSIENIRQKIEFYDSINMHKLAIIDPKYLMQSIDLSYARYKFYEDIGINITIDNYRKLFIGQKCFEKKYGITKQELLKKYNYREYLEENRNGRTI